MKAKHGGREGRFIVVLDDGTWQEVSLSAIVFLEERRFRSLAKEGTKIDFPSVSPADVIPLRAVVEANLEDT